MLSTRAQVGGSGGGRSGSGSRYCKKPLRGPYGEMLEEEMRKSSISEKQRSLYKDLAFLNDLIESGKRRSTDDASETVGGPEAIVKGEVAASAETMLTSGSGGSKSLTRSSSEASDRKSLDSHATRSSYTGSSSSRPSSITIGEGKCTFELK